MKRIINRGDIKKKENLFKVLLLDANESEKNYFLFAYSAYVIAASR